MLVDDALRAAELVRSFDGPVVDVGSGGGSPGIPLAFALPDREITLLESSRRKCHFLDRFAPVRQRASVQGLFVVLTSGLGSLLGNVMAGELATQTSGDVLVFLVPCVITGAMLIYFALGFRSQVSAVDQSGTSHSELLPPTQTVREMVQRA